MQKLISIISSNDSKKLENIVNNIKDEINIVYCNTPIEINLIDLLNDVNKFKKFGKNYNKILLERNNDFEIFLLCWSKNAITPLHKHPKNGCVMLVLDGELEEHLFKNNNLIKVNNYKKGNIGYIHDDIANHLIISNNQSISLHIYSPPKFIFKSIV